MPGLRIDSWPDRDNRSSADIDALAGPLAIEHTSLDTVEEQRRDGNWFSTVVDPIERGVGRTLKFRLDVIFPYSGVTKGQDWTGMRAALEQFVEVEAGSLPEGRSQIDLAAVPFPFEVIKASNQMPGTWFMRRSPQDESFAQRLQSQVRCKAAKLCRYRAEGRRTVLLLESDDVALMSKEKLVAALRSAFPAGKPESLDEVWYADTSIPNAPRFFDLTDSCSGPEQDGNV